MIATNHFSPGYILFYTRFIIIYRYSLFENFSARYCQRAGRIPLSRIEKIPMYTDNERTEEFRLHICPSCYLRSQKLCTYIGILSIQLLNFDQSYRINVSILLSISGKTVKYNAIHLISSLIITLKSIQRNASFLIFEFFIINMKLCLLYTQLLNNDCESSDLDKTEILQFSQSHIPNQVFQCHNR